MTAVRALTTFQESAIASGQAPLPALVPDRPARPPVQYQAALQALVACQSIDEATEWESVADAMAAWAKVYADDRVATEARRLKLHAYRRIGKLAEQLAKDKPSRDALGRQSRGAQHELTMRGFNRSRSMAVQRISKLPEAQFREVVGRDRPPAPSTLAHVQLARAPKWRGVTHTLGGLLSKMRKVSVADAVKDMSKADRATAERQAREACTWLVDLIDAVKERE